MLSHLRFWRERGWTPIDAADYADAWANFGGSVATHPEVVARLADLAGIPVRYLGWVADGQLQIGGLTIERLAARDHARAEVAEVAAVEPGRRVGRALHRQGVEHAGIQFIAEGTKVLHVSRLTW